MTKEEKQAKNNLRNFLANLTRLTHQYGLEIGGCGDCGSPWVVRQGNLAYDLEHLYYCRECKTYGEYGQHSGCF